MSHPRVSVVRKVHLLPNLLTLANSFCGLLAICKAIDAQQATDLGRFYANLEASCWLIFAGMIFDAVDGKVARMVGGSSAFGAQLDSFSDMLTFGVAPGILAKILIEHEGPLYDITVNPRLTFVAAMVFTVMAILRLARFNLENDPDPEAHRAFKGLPSPAAAGAVTATMLMYLSLRHPDLEKSDGILTPLGGLLGYFPDLRMSEQLVWFLPVIGVMLPILGLLMVSRIRNVHMTSYLTERGQFVTLVGVVVAAVALWLFPTPALFCVFNGYVLYGLLRLVFGRKQPKERAA
ncbi:MAG: CDP-alcohol phosphatidyltransferase family protein [Planctomycetes bacterium]|nr:CDP-alcohol phosphatidyltransferase family protein [Planctomycetota bacterium]